MSVYHWTTRKNADVILREGLREGSFVCESPDVWRGEVCLKIEGLNMYTDEETWQAVTSQHVGPDKIMEVGDDEAERDRDTSGL